jgi:hypothetical protein
MERWFVFEPVFPDAVVNNKAVKTKNLVKMPPLPRYDLSPEEKFWQIFPKNDLPSETSCSVNLEVLQRMIDQNINVLSKASLERAKTTLENLRKGASACQKSKLPGCFVKNADSTVNFGEEVTNTIATWTKNGFVAGPFGTPPLPNFRANKLMPIDQGNKVRLILDVSEPKGASFNDNVNELKVEKVFMSTARLFGHSVIDCGKNAIMSKSDFVDAYKIIPAQVKDLNIQGFCWLNKFFVETRQIFGAKTAVANFDTFGNTIKELAAANLDIPKKYFHRTLDDIPLVCPYDSNWCADFCKSLKLVCETLNVPLAPDCPNNEKAFSCEKYGKVLGIYFDTVNLSWKYPNEKKEKIIGRVKFALDGNFLDLKAMQQLLGSLNDFCQMFVFLRGFKFNLNNDLKVLISNPEVQIKLSEKARTDLKIWANFLLYSNEWNPIPSRYHYPPISHFELISDASGKFSEKLVGCGNIGFNFDGTICFAHQLFWPKEFLMKIDGKGSRFYCKTCTLEMIGIIIPFLLAPEMLAGKYVKVLVDNIGCVYGWINRQTAEDECASILIRALHLIATYISCQIHIEHLPRNSTWSACVVDRLSRDSTTTVQDRKLLSSFSGFVLPAVFRDWLNNPVESWDLAFKLLKTVKNKMK